MHIQYPALGKLVSFNTCKLLAQQENLLVQGYQMGYFSSLKLSINLQWNFT